MAKKKKVGDPERIFDWSGGMNNAVNPALLNDNESVLLDTYTLDEKGTLFPAKGAQNRYASPFGSSPVAGMGAFYKSDGTSRLLIGTEDGKLYVDTPHLINQWDTQGEFNGGRHQATVATSDGKVWPMVISTGFEDGYFADFHTKDAGWAIDDTVYKSGAKSAKGTGTTQKLIREFGFNAGQVYVKLAVRFAETNQQHFPVIFKSPTDTEIQAVVADSDGHFKYHNGSALANFPTDKTYAANTWYVVEVWVRGGTFWVSIDGVSLTPSGLALKDTANNSQSQVAKFVIQNAGATAATTWVDDVLVSLLAPVFSRSSVAYKSDGTQVAANVPRFEAGKFGQAVLVEEWTTNLLTAAQADGTAAVDINFLCTVTPADTTHSRHGGSALKVAWNGTVGDAHVTYNLPANLAASTSYAFEVWVYAESNIYLPADSIFIQENGGSWRSIAAVGSGLTFIPAGVWTRLTGVGTTMADWYDLSRIVLRPAKDAAGNLVTTPVWYDTLKVEQKAYVSSWIDGATTRSAEVLTIPTAGVLNPQEGTVECWVYVPEFWQPGIPYWRRIWGIGRGAGAGMYVLRYDPGSGKMVFEIYDNAGTAQNISVDKPSIGWHYFATRWSASEMALFIDDVKVGYISNPSLPTNFADTVFSIGCRPDSPYDNINTLIDDLRISSKARTDAEIADAYASNAPLPVDADTTYKLPLDGNLNVEAAYTWISPVIDASNATDKASGHAALTADTPGGSTVSVQSRSAPASTGPWTAWVNALADGTLQHTPDSYIQVRLIMTRSGDDDPDVDKLVVSFDGQASATLLASDFTAGGQFFFGQLTDYLAIVNGLDAPRKYDGATLALIGGSPPHASYVAAHKNRLWLAKGSRLYFSDLLNIDSWPALNFIDIMPQDGDTITGLLVYGDYLIITKQHSVWMLTGDGINTFSVRRIHADRGAYAPRSLCIVNQMLCFISDDGIYFSDFTQPVLISERVRQTWAGLNKRRLNLVASWFTEHKLYVAVPEANSQRNSMAIVYDTLRQAFAGIRRDIKASCFCDFREAGEINTFFGRSDTGQVMKLNAGYSNAGQAYATDYRSKEFSFGAPEVLKRFNKVYFQVKPAAAPATLTISFIVDGQETASMDISVPADTSGLIHTLLVLASKVGVIAAHRLGIRIRQNVLDNPVGIQTIYIESMPVLIKPTIRG